MTETVLPKREQGSTGISIPDNLLPADIASLSKFVETNERKSSWDQVRNGLKELMKLAVQKSKEKKGVELQAFSGEADPRIWNYCSAELDQALEFGMEYNHLVGPIVCTEDDGRNAILNALEKYQERVHLRIFRTRYPYHWVRLTWYENGERQFELKGEGYHRPLSDSRWTYEIELKSKKDQFRADKLLMWYSRQQNYTESVPITREVKSVDELDRITLDQLRNVLEQLGPVGETDVHPYDRLTRTEILAKIQN